jgi:hypothetical protein
MVVGEEEVCREKGRWPKQYIHMLINVKLIN